MSKIKRVVLFGTESTGKSALAKALASHFDEPWADEFVREFWDRRNGEIRASDLSTVARGQMVNEAVAELTANRILICDTDLLMNVRWAEDLYAGDCPDWVREAADERAGGYALYLFCEPDLGWEVDPQRSFSDRDAWLASAERCRAMLEERGLPWVTVGGRGETRIAAAIKAIEQILTH